MKFLRLEAVRGFAAVYVTVAHIIIGHYDVGRFSVLLQFGQEAVMVFFVLSGFVVYWASAKHDAPLRYGDYVWKRFLRIYSVWTPAMVALFVISSVEMGQFSSVNFKELIGNALMLQDFSSGKPSVICSPLFGDAPLWSLHYEWWFYMLFPAVMAVTSVRTRHHFIGLIAVIASVTYAFTPNVICRLLMYFSVWWIGAHAAQCLKAWGAIKLADLRWPLFYTAAASVPQVILSGLAWRSGAHLSAGVHPVLESRHLLGAVCLVLVAFAWRRWHWRGFALTFKHFSIAAPISFSLYVIHYRSIANASYLANVGTHWVALLLYVGFTLAFCYATEILIFPWLRRHLRFKDALKDTMYPVAGAGRLQADGSLASAK